MIVSLLVLAACAEPPPTDAGPADGGRADAGPPVDPCVADPASCPVDPCEGDPCEPGRVCVPREGIAECRCPAGTHDEDGSCVVDTACEPTTCNGHGTCAEEGGALSCECDTGYAGAFCDACDDGFFDDGRGACDADLCDPNPCSEPRPRCSVVDGAVSCGCAAGRHDEGGECVPDVVCLPSSCNEHGSCDASGGAIGCTCDEGWGGNFCEACAEGFHPDGAGGCTTDACLPNPCTAPRESICTATEAGRRCDCDAGAHREGDACVPDEVCEADTCSGRGTCSVSGGVTECACDAAYAGDACEACAEGFHDDGAGGCTDDACMPSPCTAPNQSVCTDDGGVARCGCDAGYHDDGIGGCTDDPCVPDPCAASGQACRPAASGGAECYTPVCDDGNPCTVDSFDGDACAFDPLPDGTACSTTLCVSGQTCGAGICGGGTTVTCDDGLPCTADRCDALLGCVFTNDDTIVPDDGVACTDDVCMAGVASHTPNHGACDDGLFCTGTESCAPGPGAGADGCVHEDVPAPPGPSTPCRYYLACDEATDSFPLVSLAAGESCDDGIACTSGDVCRSGGACAGTPLPDCPGDTCSAITPWSSAFDIPSGTVSGAVTLDGAPLPAMQASAYLGDATLYAIARDTGTRHVLGYIDYEYSSSGYVLRPQSRTLDARLVPGVYDLLYRRYQSSSSAYGSSTGRARAADPFPAGDRMLGVVVVGPGANVIDVDIPSSAISGTVTLDGAPLPAMQASAHLGDATLYAVAHDTGTRHLLGYIDYEYSSSGYVLRADSRTLDARLVPGVYDILYRRFQSSSDDYGSSTGRARSADPFPAGDRILREGVVVSAGATTIDVDIPSSAITGTVTLDGAPLPAMQASAHLGDATLYAVAHDTGTRHLLGYIDYEYSSSGYVLRADSRTLDARLVPGVYDILYRRFQSSSDDYGSSTGRARSADPFPAGDRIVREGVVVTTGATTIDVDIPTSAISGTVTLDGAPLPAMQASAYLGDATLYAVARDTGTRHLLGYIDYEYSSSGYVLRADSRTLDARLVPGVYDILYRRYQSSSSAYGSSTGRARSADPFPAGDRIVRSGVVVEGDTTIDVDIPSSALTGTVTLDGAPLPAMQASAYLGDATLYLVARDTGTRHVIGYIDYEYSSTGYRLRADSRTLDARVVPGVYDVLYRRYQSSSDDYGSSTGRARSADPFPAGDRLLATGVVVSAGSTSLDVDIPSVALGGPVTLDGAPLPPVQASAYLGDATLYAVARDTGTRHVIGYVDYEYSSTGYRLRADSRALDARLVPGVYDLLYRRYQSSSAGYGSSTGRAPAADPFPAGDRLVGVCVAIDP